MVLAFAFNFDFQDLGVLRSSHSEKGLFLI
jgi:hypothetical protein